MAKVRNVLFFLVLLLLSNNYKIYAQNSEGMYLEEEKTFYGGLLAGANFTQVDGDRFAGYHKTGINVGGIVYTRLATNFAASIEILYSQKGSRSKIPNTSVSGLYDITSYRANLDYAEIPVMLNYFDRRRSHFGGGLSYSQLVSGREIIETVQGPINTDDYPFRKSDLNLILAGNLHLYKGFFLQARFQYSVYNIRTRVHPEFGRVKQYNNLWVLRMMYLF